MLNSQILRKVEKLWKNADTQQILSLLPLSIPSTVPHVLQLVLLKPNYRHHNKPLMQIFYFIKKIDWYFITSIKFALCITHPVENDCGNELRPDCVRLSFGAQLQQSSDVGLHATIDQIPVDSDHPSTLKKKETEKLRTKYEGILIENN